MDHENRHKRLRSLIRNLNRQRKRQAQQIDILCHDLIVAQKQFIQHLETLSFVAAFYKSLLGIRDLGRLLDTAGQNLGRHTSEAHVVFHLRQNGLFRRYAFDSEPDAAADQVQLVDCLTVELAEEICKANKTCSLDDLLTLGLQANPAVVNRLSAVTIPLCQAGRSLGFIMLCRPTHQPFTTAEIHRVSSVSGGLAAAIEACEAVSSPSQETQP
jgi:hypothetical protein